MLSVSLVTSAKDAMRTRQIMGYKTGQFMCYLHAGMTTLDGFMQSLHNMENPEILQFKET